MYYSALILNAKNAKMFVVIPKIASVYSHRCIFDCGLTVDLFGSKFISAERKFD